MVSGFTRHNDKDNKRYVTYDTDNKKGQNQAFSKAEVLARIIENQDFKQIKDLLVYYRHSELPSPTNEVNLVKPNPKSKSNLSNQYISHKFI